MDIVELRALLNFIIPEWNGVTEELTHFIKEKNLWKHGNYGHSSKKRKWSSSFLHQLFRIVLIRSKLGIQLLVNHGNLLLEEILGESQILFTWRTTVLSSGPQLIQ